MILVDLDMPYPTQRDIVDVLTERVGWNKNTTYTVIKKCIEKGAVEREESGFRRGSQAARKDH